MDIRFDTYRFLIAWIFVIWPTQEAIDRLVRNRRRHPGTTINHDRHANLKNPNGQKHKDRI